MAWVTNHFFEVDIENLLLTINAENYAHNAAIVFLVVFSFFTALQLLSPHHANILGDFKNWRVNLLLSLTNTLILSSLSGRWLLPRMQEVTNFNASTVINLLLIVLGLDFVSYLWHRANHKFHFLWRFHEVHHSDRNFDTSTAVRFHLGELLISFCIRWAVVTIAQIPIEGLFVYEIFFQFFNIFSHGNIKLPRRLENLLGLIFITPAIHRKHHSVLKADLDTNFGTIFSFWDRLGRTFKHGQSSEVYPLGLPGQKSDWRLVEMFVKPFTSIN